MYSTELPRPWVNVDDQNLVMIFDLTAYRVDMTRWYLFRHVRPWGTDRVHPSGKQVIYRSNFNKPGPKHAGRHLSGPQVSGHINDGAACMVSTPVMINGARHRRPYESHMYNYNPIYQREGLGTLHKLYLRPQQNNFTLWRYVLQ